jgi:hypothetical protein
VKQLLDAILELIGLLFAQVFNPRAIAAERRVLHRSVERRVIDAVELEREEQEVRRGAGDALLHVAIKFGAYGIAGVAGVHEVGEGNEPAKQILDRLVTFDRGGKRRPRAVVARERCQCSLVALFEREAFGLGRIEIALHLGSVDRRIKVGEIPFWQRPQCRLGPRGRGSCDGGARRASGHGRSWG